MSPYGPNDIAVRIARRFPRRAEGSFCLDRAANRAQAAFDGRIEVKPAMWSRRSLSSGVPVDAKSVLGRSGQGYSTL